MAKPIRNKGFRILAGGLGILPVLCLAKKNVKMGSPEGVIV